MFGIDLMPCMKEDVVEKNFHHIKILLIIAVLTFIFSFFLAENNTKKQLNMETTMNKSNVTQYSKTKERASIINLQNDINKKQDQSQIDLNFWHLDTQQRLQDFDYFWNILNNNYPYWGLSERRGILQEPLYKAGRKILKENDTDEGLYQAISMTCYYLQNAGHLSVLEPNSYNQACEIYFQQPHDNQWYQALNNKISIGQYQKLNEFLTQIKTTKQSSFLSKSQNGQDILRNQGKHLQEKLFPNQKVAYISIHSFDQSKIKEDEQALFDFYKKINEQDYKHMIIDIRFNGGGADAYYRNNIIAPNIETPINSQNILLLNNNAYNRSFVNQILANSSEQLANQSLIEKLTIQKQPISALPKFPKLHRKDIHYVTNFLKIDHTIYPSSDEPLFSGQVWIWVGENVYSAAESFVNMCKQTNFATLIGMPTGGDGVGFDPVMLVLPNSGLVVRYSATLTLNSDGSNNEEFGTEPDIVLEQDASLDQLIELIHAYQILK